MRNMLIALRATQSSAPWNLTRKSASRATTRARGRPTPEMLTASGRRASCLGFEERNNVLCAGPPDLQKEFGLDVGYRQFPPASTLHLLASIQDLLKEAVIVLPLPLQ